MEKPAEVAQALGERAYLFTRAALISDEGLLMTPRRTDTDGFFVSLLAAHRMTRSCKISTGSRRFAVEPAMAPSSNTSSHDKILIVDFGSQVTQLIARRVREEGVYCEIVPFQKAEAALREMKPKAVILSGGPASVLDKDAPLAPMAIYEAGVPVLGICYGEQAMAHQLGGKVEAGHHREFGRAEVELTQTVAALRRRLAGRPELSGLDEPRRPGHQAAARLSALGTSANAPIAMIADDKRKFYATQFHLEVVHTPHGAAHPAQFRAQDRGLRRRLDHARLQGRGDRENPPPGRQGPG